jgi:poly(beta-D-mannuronate) lyase
VNVSTSAELSSSASGAQPGDCIVAANGTYSAFTVTANATASSPILIKAANRLGATIGSGILRIQNASHVTVEGFRVTSAGGNLTLDGVSRNVIVSIADSDDCRITRFDFKPTAHANGTSYVMLNGNSNRNRVDHSDFGPNTKDSVHYVWPTGNPVIAGVTKPTDRTPWAEGNGPYNPNMARQTQIDHNYFHDMASGTAECVVLGGIGMTGDYQDLGSLVEWNLFTACDGDPEIISIKSSGTIARYNTIRTSSGGIVNRAGNKSQIYGNFFLQGRKSGSIGVRLHEMDHKVYNNYIDGALGNAIIVASGDRYDGDFAHAQVRRAQITHNTAVNSAAVTFGSWGNNELAPVDCVFANNILSGADTLLGTAKPGNTVFSHNIYNGNLGQSRAQSEFWGVNPQLVTVNGLQKLSASSPAIGYANTTYYPYILDDMDGHPRSLPDAGADEYAAAAIVRRALTTADVGPNAQ